MAVAGAAKRYGQAAFDVAREHGLVDQWELDFLMISDVLSDPGTMDYFQSPAVRRSAKVEALTSMLPDESQVLLRNLLLLLLERRRFHQIQDVVAVFQSLVLEERGIAVARVATAVELTEEELEMVRGRLSTILNKQIEIVPQVNPEIIGGIVAQIGDDLFDGSVRSQLASLKRRLAN
ncbi:MAG: ATP synthase F1 subunit delta [Sphaerobacteraceae bacterium]|nr:MAG: ATP synthase F1 subunit delta [Sphaerobacteraceae bacterium]